MTQRCVESIDATLSINIGTLDIDINKRSSTQSGRDHTRYIFTMSRLLVILLAVQIIVVYSTIYSKAGMF
jgi:hypothetical protein